MAYRFMQENRGKCTVREMAGLLGVHCAAYYQWAKYGLSHRRQEAAIELIRLISEIVKKHHRRYGR